MDLPETRGFTIIELLTTIVVLGLILLFSVPAYQNFTQTQALNGAVENLAGHLRLASQRAVATGVDHPMRFEANTSNSDYRILLANGTVPAKWKLPNGITYQSTTSVSVTMTKDGRASASNTIVLKDLRGRRDTVSVLSSGLILAN